MHPANPYPPSGEMQTASSTGIHQPNPYTPQAYNANHGSPMQPQMAAQHHWPHHPPNMYPMQNVSASMMPPSNPPGPLPPPQVYHPPPYYHTEYAYMHPTPAPMNSYSYNFPPGQIQAPPSVQQRPMYGQPLGMNTTPVPAYAPPSSETNAGMTNSYPREEFGQDRNVQREPPPAPLPQQMQTLSVDPQTTQYSGPSPNSQTMQYQDSGLNQSGFQWQNPAMNLHSMHYTPPGPNQYHVQQPDTGLSQHTMQYAHSGPNQPFLQQPDTGMNQPTVQYASSGSIQHTMQEPDTRMNQPTLQYASSGSIQSTEQQPDATVNHQMQQYSSTGAEQPTYQNTISGMNHQTVVEPYDPRLNQNAVPDPVPEPNYQTFQHPDPVLNQQLFQQPDPAINQQTIQASEDQPITEPLMNSKTEEELSHPSHEEPVFEKTAEVQIVQNTQNLPVEEDHSVAFNPLCPDTTQEVQESEQFLESEEDVALREFVSHLQERLAKKSRDDQAQIIQTALNKLGLHECIDILEEEFGRDALFKAAGGKG
eukprot:g9266.t1